MKRIITILLFILFSIILFAQGDTIPISGFETIQSPFWKVYTLDEDSTIWMYGGNKYGWTQLVPFRKYKKLLDSAQVKSDTLTWDATKHDIDTLHQKTIDSILIHRTEIDELKNQSDSLLQLCGDMNSDFSTVSDSLSYYVLTTVFDDSLAIFRQNVSDLQDTVSVHLDTLQSHNLRILALSNNIDQLRLDVYDSLNVHHGQISINENNVSSLYDSLTNIYTVSQINYLLGKKTDTATTNLLEGRIIEVEGLDTTGIYHHNRQFLDSLTYATLQDVLIGTDTSKIITPLIAAQRDSLLNVPYSGALSSIYTDYNFTADSIFANYFNISFADIDTTGIYHHNRQFLDSLSYATLQDVLIGVDTSKIITPFIAAQRDSLLNVPYSGAIENIYTDYNFTADSIFANYFNIDFDSLQITVSQITDLPIQVINETPTGTINGTNDTFSTAYNFISGTTEVYLNGVLQIISVNYTEGSGQIVFETGNEPYSGDYLRINYNY